MGKVTDSRPRFIGLLLRPFKALARVVLGRMVRRLSRRFADEIVPLIEVRSRLDKVGGKVEAFYWDHVALSRRLAVIEDRLDRLQRQGSPDAGADGVELQSVVPFVASDASGPVRELNRPALKLERAG